MSDLSSQIIVISNTGPLISAFQCRRVALLQRYFETIHIPESALTEFERHGAEDMVRKLIDEGFISVELLTDEEQEQAEQIARRIAASSFDKLKDYTYHLTEAEAMVLMNRKEISAARILLEERAAREVAKKLGLPLTGFIGVLLRACRDKLLTPDELRELLEDCRRQGTRYSDALITEMSHKCQEVRNK